MTGITLDGLQIDREFTAPAAAVWAAWTTPESFARWFGGDQALVPLDGLDFHPEAGREWSAMMILSDGSVKDWCGSFLEVQPISRLAFTITDDPTAPERHTVVVDLAATSHGTRLRLTQHAPNLTAPERRATIAGWRSFLDVLERIARS